MINDKYIITNNNNNGYLIYIQDLFVFQPYFNNDKLLPYYYRNHKGISKKSQFFITSKEDRKNKIINEKLTKEEQKSLKIMSLSIPISVDEIKKKYKKLVKIFHPDVNDNNKKAENHFKEINEAYKILLKKFLKKNI